MMDEFILKYKAKETFFITYLVVYELKDLKVILRNYLKRINQICHQNEAVA